MPITELDKIREAFESRSVPNLDLSRNENGDYRYQAARLSFCDFADGWKAARNETIQQANKQKGDVIIVWVCALLKYKSDLTSKFPALNAINNGIL